MGQRLTDLNFEEWVVHIFDHPVADPAWHWDMNAEWWSSAPEETISYLTQLFENDGAILAPYSDAQLNQGFWYLVSSASGDYLRILQDSALPIQDRVRCIQSIFNLYEQVFAVRCSPHLSNLLRTNEPQPNDLSALNAVCYMWWDILFLYGAMEIDNLQIISEAVLNVMKKTLELDSIACQESALHGLGHWHHYFPKETYDIIEEWLEKHPNISEELREYAERAQAGAVL